MSNQKGLPSPNQSPVEVQPDERISITAGMFAQLITLAENAAHTLPFKTVAGIIQKAKEDVQAIKK
jgi:hypothetical protein